MAHYLVCYDISDPKRLRRVHRQIIKHAVFIQLSVYYFQGNRFDLEKLLSDLECVIDNRADDVRAYSVRAISDALQIGCSWLPEGVGLYDKHQ